MKNIPILTAFQRLLIKKVKELIEYKFGETRMRRQQKTQFSFQDNFPDVDFSCNREEELFRYFQRLLSHKDAENFERHLRICSGCAERLSELQEAIEVSQSTAIDMHIADKIFQENLLRLKKVLASYSGQR